MADRKKAKPAKQKRVKKDDPEQSQRFVETARKLKVDASGESFEKALKEIADSQAGRSRPSEKQSSS